jgi:hypothetical protein
LTGAKGTGALKARTPFGVRVEQPVRRQTLHRQLEWTKHTATNKKNTAGMLSAAAPPIALATRAANESLLRTNHMTIARSETGMAYAAINVGKWRRPSSGVATVISKNNKTTASSAAPTLMLE